MNPDAAPGPESRMSPTIAAFCCATLRFRPVLAEKTAATFVGRSNPRPSR